MTSTDGKPIIETQTIKKKLILELFFSIYMNVNGNFEVLTQFANLIKL